MVCSRLSTLFPPVVVLCACEVQLCLTEFETETTSCLGQVVMFHALVGHQRAATLYFWVTKELQIYISEHQLL